MMRKTLAFLTFVLLAEASVAETVFSLTVQKRGAEAKTGVATLVADELVLTSARLTEAGDSYVVANAKGVRFVASLAHRNEDSDLALLSVIGLEGTPAIVAAGASEAGRKVHVLLPGDDRREGAMHSHVERNGIKLYRFSVPAGDGAPLMNNCNELLAISQSPRRRWQREDRQLGISGELSSLTAFLTAQSVAFAAAPDKCLSVEEQLSRAKEEREVLEQEKVRLEQQATQSEQQNQERLAEIEAERQELTKELEEKQQQLADKERLQRELEQKRQEERQLADEEARKAEQERQKAEQQAREAEEERRKAEEQVRKAEEVRQAQHFRILVGGGILGAILAALGIFLLVRARARKRRLARTDEELSDARNALERASAVFPDVVLAGSGPDGEEVRLKINGNALARSDGGQVIGRSASSADYVLSDRSVSRQHARLQVDGDALTIEDLGSLNGTRLDGANLPQGQPQIVANGATLTMGDLALVAHILSEEKLA